MGTLYRTNLYANIHWVGDRDTEVGIVSVDGPPNVKGANATGKDILGRGSIIIDTTTGDWYNNIGTKAEPVWKNMVGEPITEVSAISSLVGDPVEALSDDEPVEVVFTAELDQSISGIPVTFGTDFAAEDIDSVDGDEGNVADFVGDDYVVISDADGEASITVVFSNGVDKDEDVTADIDDSDQFVSTSDTETITDYNVDTTSD